MKIVFDRKKDELNKKEHDGLSLSMARMLDWDNMYYAEDDRVNYGEYRYVGITANKHPIQGLVQFGKRMFSVCFTFIDDDPDDLECIRVISLRYATKREIEKYAKA